MIPVQSTFVKSHILLFWNYTKSFGGPTETSKGTYMPEPIKLHCWRSHFTVYLESRHDPSWLLSDFRVEITLYYCWLPAFPCSFFFFWFYIVLFAFHFATGKLCYPVCFFSNSCLGLCSFPQWNHKIGEFVSDLKPLCQ